MSNLLKLCFFCVIIYICIIYLILLQYILIFIMKIWNTCFTYEGRWLLFPLSGNLNLCKKNSFHMLWRFIQEMFNNIRHDCEYFKICKEIDLSVFNKNVTKFWDDGIKWIINKPGKVQAWKNEFWQKNPQKTTLLLFDHLLEKGRSFSSCFLVWFYILVIL